MSCAKIQRAGNDTCSFHALITSLNLQHPKLTWSYNHVTITWLSVYDCCSLLIPSSGQVFCLLTETIFSLAINLNHSVKTKEIVLLSQALLSQKGCVTQKVTLYSDSCPSSHSLLLSSFFIPCNREGEGIPLAGTRKKEKSFWLEAICVLRFLQETLVTRTQANGRKSSQVCYKHQFLISHNRSVESSWTLFMWTCKTMLWSSFCLPRQFRPGLSSLSRNITL